VEHPTGASFLDPDRKAPRRLPIQMFERRQLMRLRMPRRFDSSPSARASVGSDRRMLCIRAAPAALRVNGRTCAFMRPRNLRRCAPAVNATTIGAASREPATIVVTTYGASVDPSDRSEA
jgi:hypothetical protein